MGKIVCLMGKSSTGKDTIYKELIMEGTLGLCSIVPYTTRPIREGEKNGVEYFFTDEIGYQKFKEADKIIEDRSYETYHGLWRYFTVADKQIDIEHNNYCIIGTLSAYMQIKAYFGEENVIPILIEVNDGIRLERALQRERAQKEPKYEEMCRRFLADSIDFSEEKIKEAQITKRFINNNLKECVQDIITYIK